MTDLQLVAYSSGDRTGFASLVNDVHAEYGFAYDAELDRDLADPDAHYSRIWVLRSGSEVVGSIALSVLAQRTMTVKRMYLRRPFRGRGWGRRLLDAATHAAMNAGCRHLLLDTDERQRAAVRLFERAGFVLYRRDGGSRYYVKELDST